MAKNCATAVVRMGDMFFTRLAWIAWTMAARHRKFAGAFPVKVWNLAPERAPIWFGLWLRRKPRRMRLNGETTTQVKNREQNAEFFTAARVRRRSCRCQWKRD